MKTLIGRRTAAIFGAASVVLLTLPGMAQTPTALPQNQAEFEKQLGITADQKKRIEAVNSKYKPQFEKLQAKYKPKVEQLQKQMVALQKQMMEMQQKYVAEAKPVAENQKRDVESILTPQQREKMKQIQTALQQQQQQRMSAMGGAMPGAQH